ncbi:immunoreactive protein Se23.5 [Lachnospiraceae bacterium KM106-2]|nr:immunoreactive protein Se23.5 [Lachnospiraceae bacterium KM106-2]
MLILYFICCILQPICLPVPEMITVVWGLNELGAVPSFVFGVLGTVMGTGLMYQFACKASDWIITKLHYEDKIACFERYIRHYQILIVALLFVVPILPDEIIGIGAPLVGISFSKYMILAAISKTVSVGMITFSEQIGRAFSINKWQVIIIELGILMIISKAIRLIEHRKLFNENGV